MIHQIKMNFEERSPSVNDRLWMPGNKEASLSSLFKRRLFLASVQVFR